MKLIDEKILLDIEITRSFVNRDFLSFQKVIKYNHRKLEFGNPIDICGTIKKGNFRRRLRSISQ